MKSAWPIKKLGEVCEIARGGSPRPIKSYLTDSDNGVNWIKISDATSSDKYIFKTREKIKREGLKKTRQVESGDLILTNSMSFGHPYIMRTSGAIHDGWLLLRPSAVIWSEYIYYFLSSQGAYEEFSRLAGGAVVQNLNSKSVASVEIPLPPLSEQKKIVARLEKQLVKVKEAKRLRADALGLTQNLLSAELHKIFAEGKQKGWEEKELGEFIKLQGGFAFKSSKYTNQGVPLVRIQNLKGEQVDFKKAVYLSVDLKKEFERFLLNDGDVLIAMSGATTGKMARIKKELLPAFLNQRVGRFVVNDDKKFDQYYLWYFLKTIQKKILADAYGGAQPNISPSKIEKMKIPLPPLSEQKKIVARLDGLQEKIEKIQQHQKSTLSDLNHLEQSILHGAFQK